MNTTHSQTVVVTGASSGIGKATAQAFARMGWHVICTGRDPERCDQARAELESSAASGARIDFLRADFCEMAQVKTIAEEISGLTDKVHVLINNAGGWRDQRYVSSEGIEATMAANHYAPFLLTRELMPLLKKAVETSDPGTVRVIAVSSTAHRNCEEIRWDDIDWEEDYHAAGIYCQAKLANILFGRELQRRHASDGIVSQIMHPGVVASNFFTHGDDQMNSFSKDREDLVTSEYPARTLVWMATAEEVGKDGGRYFHDLAEEEPAPHALDEEAAARLWQVTEERLASLGY